MRIRSVKPEFWRSDDIAALSREERLLFIGLWSYVDDNGVGVDDHRQIAADLFALEDDQNEAREFVREGLATLSRGFLIARYMINGKRYLYITGWKKHQRIDKAAKPRYPEPPPDLKPPTSENAPENDHVATLSRHSRETLAPGTGEQGNRGTGEQGLAGRVSKSGTDRAREAVGAPHSPRAHRLVDAWSTTCQRRPTAKIRSQLAVEVDGLIDDAAWTDADIASVLQFWNAKGLGPGALHSVAHEWANPRRDRASPATTNATDTNIRRLFAGIQPDQIAIGGAP